MKSLNIRIVYDKTAKVWVTASSGVIGLTALAPKKKDLIEQIKKAAPLLLDLNRDSTRFSAEPDGRYKINIEEPRRIGKPKSLGSFEVQVRPLNAPIPA